MPFAVRAFLDTLPLPDNIGAAEYRALHGLLFDLDSDDLDGNDLDVVEATLNEVVEWALVLRARLGQHRARSRAPLSSSGVTQP